MQGEKFQQLLDDFDAHALCDGVFRMIIERHGNRIDVSKESELERVVTLVWASKGIIENGGFQYLFEGNFDGDPGFVLTAAAFRRIGCPEAAEAFEQALSLFTGNQPPGDIEARLEIYESIPQRIRRQIDVNFCDAQGALERTLAAFIRANAEAL